jgi:DNA sulfur modification protein DndB
VAPVETSIPARDALADAPTLTFLALRSVQAGREYFVAVLPLKLVPRLLTYDESSLPAELRAQRVLNAARVPEIARYLTENPRGYVLSAITASVDADPEFEPLEAVAGASVGRLVIPLTARLLVNDGQHRRAAIEAALEQQPDLGDETVPVVFFVDAGLKRAQQMFADLNRYALRPTRSLGILYDHRDPLASLAREIATTVHPFAGYTELEKTSISNRSTKVFTLSGIYQAVEALLGRRKEAIPPMDAELAVDYWARVGELIVSWGFVNDETSAADLRQSHIHTYAVALHALGLAGAALVSAYPDDWQARLEPLAELDWSRANHAQWEGRALHGSRISKAGASVTLTANVLKAKLGLPLNENELELEEEVRIAA